jgi:hypothetical protein
VTPTSCNVAGQGGGTSRRGPGRRAQQLARDVGQARADTAGRPARAEQASRRIEPRERAPAGKSTEQNKIIKQDSAEQSKNYHTQRKNEQKRAGAVRKKKHTKNKNTDKQNNNH